MSVRVLAGTELKIHQDKLTLQVQQKEFIDRVRSLLGRYSSDSYNEYGYRTLFEVYLARRGDVKQSAYASGFAEKHPALGLMVLDVLEALGQVDRFAAKLVSRYWIQRVVGMKALSLTVKFVAEDAYRVAAEAQTAIEIIRGAYGQKIAKGLKLRVDVVEKPYYVSPRMGLTALEGA